MNTLRYAPFAPLAPLARLCIATLASLVALAAATKDTLPLGHPDFLPSDQRPVGYRGDGTGRFPGATPPTRWNLRTGENVRWCAPLPTTGSGAATVVGDRIFVQCGDLLIIHDHTTRPFKLSGSGKKLTWIQIASNPNTSPTIRDMLLGEIDSQVIYDKALAGWRLHARTVYANPTPHGDALYIRTPDALWCVGD